MKNFFIGLYTLLLITTAQQTWAQVDDDVAPIKKQNKNSSIERDDDDKSKGSKLNPDSIPNVIMAWQLSDDNANEQSVPVDTFMSGFQIFQPTVRHAIVSSRLGNLGLAAMPALFYKRSNDRYFLFKNTYANYLITPENTKFYTTNKPFTNLFYTTPQRRLEHNYVSFLHTQNINPRLNVGFVYQLISVKGQYDNQQTKDYSVGMFSSYNNRRYTLYFVTTYNKFKNDENGGVVQDSSGVNTDILPVFLNDTYSRINVLNAKLVQRYAFTKKQTVQVNDTTTRTVKIPTLQIIHNIEYERDYKIYEDKSPLKTLSENYSAAYIAKTPFANYYKNYYTNELISNDSAYFNRLTNHIQLKMHDSTLSFARIGARVLAGYDVLNYYNYKNFFQPATDTTYGNLYATAALYSQSGKFMQWSAWFTTYLQGYDEGNSNIGVQAYKKIGSKSDAPFVHLQLTNARLRPSYFEQQYLGNRVRWQKTFDNKTETRAMLMFAVPRFYFQIAYHAALLDNYIYFDANALPQQHTANIMLQAVELNQDVHLKPFHLRNKLVYQLSSDDAITRLPALTTYHSLYVEFRAFKVLQTQIGFDVFFNTPYQLPAYMPATGMFYHQDAQQSLIYPMVDAFLNARLRQRARLFLKAENLLSLLESQVLGGKYYTTAYYPLDQMGIKFGFSWLFHD